MCVLCVYFENLHFFKCFVVIKKKGNAGEGKNGEYINFEEMETNFWVEVLKSVKCTVSVCCQGDFGIVVFGVC